MGMNDYNSDFGCTAAQYQGQLSRLWHALGPIKNQTNEDVFTLAVRAIEDAQQRPSRREIAAMAMQGLLSNSRFDLGPRLVAEGATQYADALIERLNADPAEGASDE
jgi:hypothetical protein